MGACTQVSLKAQLDVHAEAAAAADAQRDAMAAKLELAHAEAKALRAEATPLRQATFQNPRFQYLKKQLRGRSHRLFMPFYGQAKESF